MFDVRLMFFGEFVVSTKWANRTDALHKRNNRTTHTSKILTCGKTYLAYLREVAKRLVAEFIIYRKVKI